MPDGFDYDLVIVGTGSGNSVPDEDLADWRIAVVEPGDFGGTCLNRGCIPSKMFVYTADVAETVRHAGRYGVHATLEGSDWPAIRDRVFGRIDPIAANGRRYRADLPNTDLFEDMARFVAPRTLQVGDRTHHRRTHRAGCRVAPPPARRRGIARGRRTSPPTTSCACLPAPTAC